MATPRARRYNSSVHRCGGGGGGGKKKGGSGGQEEQNLTKRGTISHNQEKWGGVGEERSVGCGGGRWKDDRKVDGGRGEDGCSGGVVGLA